MGHLRKWKVYESTGGSNVALEVQVNENSKNIDYYEKA